MNTEDEEFNRIEREAAMRKEAVAATVAKREWLDLTDREMMDAIDIDDSPMAMGRKIEAKIKEKNT
jgi:hypothetical protein